MKCDFCGKDGVRRRIVARTYGKRENLFIIENIPIFTCPQCGESYLEAQTLHDIERIKIHKKALSVNKTIPVAQLG